MLFQDGRFQWKRLENLLSLAQQGAGGGAGLDLSDTVASGARVVLADSRLRTQLLMALTEDNRLHIDVRVCSELCQLCLHQNQSCAGTRGKVVSSCNYTDA